jgi:hypothetical protein
MANNPVFDMWVKQAFGVDPASYVAAKGPAANASGEVTVGAEPAGGLFGKSKDKDKGADKGGDLDAPLLDGEGAPSGDGDGTVTAKPRKRPPLTLTSETEATQPAKRTRTKIGVGERVTLKLTPVSGDWTCAGAGTLTATKGSTVTLIASGKAGTAKITVTAQGKTKKINFTVIAPSTVHQDTQSVEHYSPPAIGLTPLPNAGFHGRVYCGPDSVNFSKITFLEAEIGCKATGSWKTKNGKGHSPNASPIGFTDTVVSGKGTESLAVDHCWSGFVPGLTLKDWSGSMTFSIPWTYQCNGFTGKIATVVQTTATDKKGATSTKKAGGSSGTFALA